MREKKPGSAAATDDGHDGNTNGGGGGGGGGYGGSGGSGGEEDFGLSGLWAVSRSARTRTVAWMGRTIVRNNDGVASGIEAGGGAEVETGGNDGGGGGGGASAMEGVAGGSEDEFTLLALAGGLLE